MKIAQLSHLLDSLVHGLDGVVAAPVTNDLRLFETALEPFRDATVGEFTKFLGDFGQAFKETGKITPQGKIAAATPPRAAKAPKQDSTQMIAAAVSAIQNLFKEIDLGSVNEERVDQVVGGISKMTVADLHKVLAELRIAEKPKVKAKILASIKEVVHHQMEAHSKAASVGAARIEQEPVSSGVAP